MIKSLIGRLADESGSAMTEFVIGLPVFILIFGGMGSLYKLNNEALKTKAQVNSELWENSGLGNLSVSPLVALTDIGDWGDVIQNGTAAFGVHTDAYAKTFLPLLIPGSQPSSGCMTLQCGQIGMDPNGFAYPLLNDNIADGINSGGLSGASGFAGVVAAGLTAVGARPAFAAGMRYGSVDGESRTVTVDNPMYGSVDFTTGDLENTAPTEPTHRVFAIALTRLEFATDDFFDKQVPEFNEEWDFGSPDSIDGGGACSGAVADFEACEASPEDGESADDTRERCADDTDVAGQCEAVGDNSGLGDLGVATSY